MLTRCDTDNRNGAVKQIIDRSYSTSSPNDICCHTLVSSSVGPWESERRDGVFFFFLMDIMRMLS